MVDYTSALMITQPEVGSDINIWGGQINDDMGLIEQAIVGRTAFTLSGTKTLTRTPGVIDEARSRILDVTAGTGGKVIIPAVASFYIVRNKASGSVLFTVDGTNGAPIATNTITFVVTDGVNVWAPNLDGYVQQVEALIAAGIVDMNAILADAEAQVALAADQVGLAADQVALAAVQVDAAEAQADAAHTFSISAGNSATAAAASAAAAAKSAADAALFDPSSYYTKAQTYSKTETDTAIAAISGKAPANLNSIEELATSINNDPAYAATVTASLALKSNLTDRGLVLISTGSVASAVAAVDITSGIDTTYDEFELHLFNFVGAASSTLVMQVSSNGGAAWVGGTFRAAGYYVDQTGSLTAFTGGTSLINVSNSTVDTAAGGVSGIVRLFRPAESLRPRIAIETSYGAPGLTKLSLSVSHDSAFIINALRLSMLSGNVASGKYKLYGVKK